MLLNLQTEVMILRLCELLYVLGWIPLRGTDTVSKSTVS